MELGMEPTDEIYTGHLSLKIGYWELLLLYNMFKSGLKSQNFQN